MKFPANKSKKFHPAVTQVQNYIKKLSDARSDDEQMEFQITPEMLDFFNFPPNYKYINRPGDLEDVPNLMDIKDVIFRDRLRDLYNYKMDDTIVMAATMLNAVYHSILNVLPNNLNNNIAGLMVKTKEELIQEAISSLKSLKIINDKGSPDTKEMGKAEKILRDLMANPQISQSDVVNLIKFMQGK